MTRPSAAESFVAVAVEMSANKGKVFLLTRFRKGLAMLSGKTSGFLCIQNNIIRFVCVSVPMMAQHIPPGGTTKQASVVIIGSRQGEK